jgi:energy-coupling factor transporter ATP-binding protein EcfA2
MVCHVRPTRLLELIVEYKALFERMIELRGQRTMIFSSHRFGKLTKHADVILSVAFCF